MTADDHRSGMPDDWQGRVNRIADALSWLAGHLLALALLPVIWQARRRIDRRRNA